MTPAKSPAVKAQATDKQPVAGAKVERIVLEVEPGIVVPVVVLTPTKATGRAPVVIALAQTGKAGFFKERAGELQKLVQGGAIVVLPDVRGSGETARRSEARAPTQSRPPATIRRDAAGATASRPAFGSCLLARTKDVDGKRIALWGDAFGPTNPADTNFKVPRRSKAGRADRNRWADCWHCSERC